MAHEQIEMSAERIQYFNGVLSALLTVATHGDAELYKAIVLNQGPKELVWVATQTELGFDLDRYYLTRHGFMQPLEKDL